MTRYLVIFTAVLIGRVVGPYYGDDWCTLPGDADSDSVCLLYEEALEKAGGAAVCSATQSNGCDTLVKRCTPSWCREDCDCDGDGCDRKCYFGCQFEEPGLIQPGPEGDGRKHYCSKVQKAWLDANQGAECNGDCGICAEPWCAQLDVTEGEALTSGSCKRDKQTWRSLISSTEKNLVCTKSMIEECDPLRNDYRLLHAGCDRTCGYPHQCDDGRNSTWNPIQGPTNFAELCPTSNFKLTRGSCEDQREPPTCDGFHAGGTHIIRWNVMRLPTFMCDRDCGMQEGRYTWGRCVHLDGDPHQETDNMCFAVTDGSGMDIGPCEIQSAGAQVFDCNGKNICECDDPEDYESVPPVKKYPTPTPYVPEVKKYPEEPKYTPVEDQAYYDEVADDNGSASTYTILSVAGIALAHAML